MSELDCVAIISGGLDSVTLLHDLVKNKQRNPLVLSFRYGQKHFRELACARAQAKQLGCTRHRIVDLSLIADFFSTSALIGPQVAIPTSAQVLGDNQPPTYVPNRNMIFLSLAVALAESIGVNDVYYGAQQVDTYGYWDTTQEFVSGINNVLGLNRRSPVQIRAPFLEKRKAAIVRLGISLGVDYANTWSCYQGGKTACGRCPACAERLAAFEEIGRKDPLPYLSQVSPMSL